MNRAEGKKYLPVSRYYRSDYIGLAMIKNFFLITIGMFWFWQGLLHILENILWITFIR